MLESARLSSAEVDGLLNQAIDADYWRRFCPELSVGSSGWRDIREECPLDPSEVGRLAEKVRTEGYFQTSAVFPLPLVHRMRSDVELLRSQNWPPAFAFVFDEFWAILRTASLERLLSSFLGQGHRQNSAVWTYYVSTQKGSAGWTPHQDGGGRTAVVGLAPFNRCHARQRVHVCCSPKPRARPSPGQIHKMGLRKPSRAGPAPSM
jgi:hypothetical protein